MLEIWPYVVGSALGYAAVAAAEKLCHGIVVFTLKTIAEDREWRLREDAPVEIAEPSLPSRFSEAIEATKTMHGVTTSSTGSEDIAVVMTELGVVTVSLVRAEGWRRVQGVGDEVAAVLRTAADELRRRLKPCDDCGGVGGVHTADCSKVSEMLSMTGEEMMERQGVDVVASGSCGKTKEE